MFMQLMSEESRQYLMQRVEYHWQQALECWKQEPQIVLFHEMQRIFFRAACDWTGIPYREEEVADCACDLGAMIDGFGGVGKRYRKGKAARKRMEQWAARWITDYRADHWANHQANRLATPPDSLTNHPAEVIALHAELNGTLLSPHVAAVELLNLIRPIVAIATYVAFMAHALHHYPEERSKLLAEEAYTEYFVQEVRRYYPFTPFVGAKTRQSFEWKGYHFPAGQLVILDVYGIDHDPRIWERPEAFLPERFRHWQENAHDFIPQGGGHYATGHRCAGEWITIDCMKTVLHLLLALEYHTPPQPWGFDLHRMPTRPKSGVMTNHIRSI
jgi:fatty-acid peroxygenase